MSIIRISQLIKSNKQRVRDYEDMIASSSKKYDKVFFQKKIDKLLIEIEDLKWLL